MTKSLLFISKLLEVLEDSVKATHLFLSNKEINNIKSYVPRALVEVSHLIVVQNENNRPIGFMKIEDRKLEILFIKNDARGKGLEKELLLREFDLSKKYIMENLKY